MGFMLLIAGCRLNWLYAGAVGFVTGGAYALLWYSGESAGGLIVIAVEIALFLAVVTVFLRKFGLALASLLAGFYLTETLPRLLTGAAPDSVVWGLAIGMLCLLAVLAWETVPLILITSLLGATAIVQSLRLSTIEPPAFLLLLVVLGIATQFVLMRYGEPDEKTNL